MDESPVKERITEIDVARGILVSAMVAYHCAYSGKFLGVWQLDLSEGSLAWWSARIIAAGFVAVSGMVAAVSALRRAGARRPRERFGSRLRGGATLLGFGMVMTIVTLLALGPTAFVGFGVLHLLGCLRLVDGPIARRRVPSLFLGVAMVAAGLYLGPLRFSFPWLFFLGFRPDSYYPIDYFPVLPWAGWYFLGVFAGNALYPAGTAWLTPPAQVRRALAPVAFLGRHSLAIYVCHVPPILGILYLWKGMVGG